MSEDFADKGDVWWDSHEDENYVWITELDPTLKTTADALPALAMRPDQVMSLLACLANPRLQRLGDGTIVLDLPVRIRLRHE